MFLESMFLDQARRHAMRKVLYKIWSKMPVLAQRQLRKSSLLKKLTTRILDSSTKNHQRIIESEYIKSELLISIDVVVTSFKQSRYIKEAVDSIMAQSFPANKIYVIEHSGLADEFSSLSQQLVSFSDSRVEVYQINDCWPGEARNFGASLGKSSLILFLDADDYLSPDYLFNSIFFLNFLCLDFVGAWCQNFTHENEVRCFGDVWKTPSSPSWSDLVASNAFPVSSLIRRSSFQEVGGWKDFDQRGERQDEAINLWRRLVLFGFKGANLQQRMIFLRRHNNNLSARESERPFFNSSKIRESWNELIFVTGVDLEQMDAVSRKNQINLNAINLMKDKTENRAIIFLIPDKTFYGAGKVIKWVCSRLTDTSQAIFINCDIQGLGGNLSRELKSPPARILDLGSLVELGSWEEFLRITSSNLQVNKITTFGHPYANPIVGRITKKYPQIDTFGFLFNINSANAFWLQENPNSFAKVFVESDLSLKFLKEAGWVESRITKFAHNAHRYSAQREYVANQNKSQKGIGVLWFGRFAIEKEPRKFLMIAASLKSSEKFFFSMAGEGPLREEIETLSNCTTNTNVTFCKNSDSSVMFDHEIYVSTSSEVEGRPLTIIEALEEGMLVFAIDSGSISEYVNDGYQGLYLFDSINRLVESLTKLDLENTLNNRESRAFKNREISNKRLDSEFQF